MILIMNNRPQSPLGSHIPSPPKWVHVKTSLAHVLRIARKNGTPKLYGVLQYIEDLQVCTSRLGQHGSTSEVYVTIQATPTRDE
jgi:hypothetical protein